MRYLSTTGTDKRFSAKDAVMLGLAPDGGLFVPEKLPRVYENRPLKGSTSLPEIGFQVSCLFFEGELTDNALGAICSEALDFDAPLVELEEGMFVLELFHGPTLAFKDFGARFMARLLPHFRHSKDGEIIVLAATSGDTGSAVASGFYGVEGIKVVLLYPSGKVSEIQEKQLTSYGGNVSACEIEGTFDDCQKLVKEAFQDGEVSEQLCLTSANSINIARLIPQTFYYFYGMRKLLSLAENIVFSVPSGNFGNLTAGLMANRMGLGVERFIAAVNSNATVPEYLKSGIYAPRPSVKTLSNAMDVGDPSNFTRILYLYKENREKISKDIWSTSVSDGRTEECIRDVYNRCGYLLDPHTAVGYAAARRFLEEGNCGPVIVLGTAHPAKFPSVYHRMEGIKPECPKRLKVVLKREKRSHRLPADFRALKSFLFKMDEN